MYKLILSYNKLINNLNDTVLLHPLMDKLDPSIVVDYDDVTKVALVFETISDNEIVAVTLLLSEFLA